MFPLLSFHRAAGGARRETVASICDWEPELFCGTDQATSAGIQRCHVECLRPTSLRRNFKTEQNSFPALVNWSVVENNSFGFPTNDFRHQDFHFFGRSPFDDVARENRANHKAKRKRRDIARSELRGTAPQVYFYLSSLRSSTIGDCGG